MTARSEKTSAMACTPKPNQPMLARPGAYPAGHELAAGAPAAGAWAADERAAGPERARNPGGSA